MNKELAMQLVAMLECIADALNAIESDLSMVIGINPDNPNVGSLCITKDE